MSEVFPMCPSMSATLAADDSATALHATVASNKPKYASSQSGFS